MMERTAEQLRVEMRQREREWAHELRTESRAAHIAGLKEVLEWVKDAPECQWVAGAIRARISNLEQDSNV